MNFTRKPRIVIPEPCHEQWDSMSSTDKGKFCLSCQKTVIDFTHYSDNQLLLFFSHQKTPVCGRFATEQLERSLLDSSSKKTLPIAKWIAASIISIPLFSLPKMTTANLKPPMYQVLEDSVVNNLVDATVPSLIVNQSDSSAIKATDSSVEPINFLTSIMPIDWDRFPQTTAGTALPYDFYPRPFIFNFPSITSYAVVSVKTLFDYLSLKDRFKNYDQQPLFWKMILGFYQQVTLKKDVEQQQKEANS